VESPTIKPHPKSWSNAPSTFFSTFLKEKSAVQLLDKKADMYHIMDVILGLDSKSTI
jgi:hypothetical protein